MRTPLILFVVVFACSSPAPQPVSVGCQRDNDCKGDRICVAGACIDPPTKAEPSAVVVSPEPENISADQEKAVREEALKVAKAVKEKEEEAKSLYKKDKLNGTVEDKIKGWVWADSDNGSKVNWQEARSLCDKKGRGWRLPSQDELNTLYENANAEHTIKADPKGLTIRHPKEFSIDAYFLWANTPVLVGNNLVIDLHTGKILRTQTDAHALCIRVDAK